MVTLMTTQNSPETGKSNVPICYIVTDIETDGPNPGEHSMLSFASVAVDNSGHIFDQFNANLAQLDGAISDSGTLAWLKSKPEAWQELQKDPASASNVIHAYLAWIRALPYQAVFVAHPLSFDGAWIDWYMRTFTQTRLCCGLYGGEQVFSGAGIDLQSLIMGITGWDYANCRRPQYPEEWFGGYAHTHKALDDALGYAHILSRMLRLQKSKACDFGIQK